MRLPEDFFTLDSTGRKELSRLLRNMALLLELAIIYTVIWGVYTGLATIVSLFI